MLETVSLEHVPSDFEIHAALFLNVRNAAFLHRQLLDRNADFEYAFVDASNIISRNHLFSAVFRAIVAHAKGALDTPNVHSEIVAYLNPSNNIADAYRRFGIQPSTVHLAVIKVTFPTDARPERPSSQAIWHHLTTNVDGDAVSPTNDNLETVTHMARVRKNYKIKNLSWLPEGQELARRSELEALILGTMALRGL
ncbi:hypothetical protein L249_5187 [Ophiocordyceps polyrhachis-furcata BCC 54312]|uniref:EKC/KEOPS complex subunit CGI121 n=1 Tax=Ophiocordyceps polyrhachis-furcata BCC 54312 TaxID=1330021 RepID=A0A367L9F1_9HYPO|nr:hypothetical protein L249_5187 [Ophiocordyceps polyrhachis-furcata BCC 54312]